MQNVPRKIDVTIRSFYIFNTTYGHKEGQEKEKILYYYPKEIDLNDKIRDVGLSQAFAAFTDSFTEKPGECEAIHTEKTTQLLYQPEPNVWLALVLNVPKEIHSKDGVEYFEYHKHELHDDIYRRLLIQSYDRFSLEYGSFKMILDKFPNKEQNARNYLTQLLECFFDKYITSLQLPANDSIVFMKSLQYLPLDKILFLRVHNFLDSLKATFSVITDAIFLYNDFVVVGGKLNPSNLFTLHQFIIENIEIIREPSPNSAVHSRNIYLEADDKLVVYKMVLFPSTKSMMCLFFQESVKLTSQLLEELNYAIKSQMSVLARDIDDFLAKQANTAKASSAAITLPSSDCIKNTEIMSPKYLFLNDQSLKLSTNLCDDEPKHRTPLPQNVTNLIADLFNSPDKVDKSQMDIDKISYDEIMIKSTDDFWIVKRRFNYRQRFVVIFSQKATLLDVTKEAERIFEQDIKDGVFADK